MPFYRVTWQIELDADTHENAALTARGIQLDPANIATVYGVQEITDELEALEDEVWIDTEQIANFKICDFCEEPCDHPEDLTYAEMRIAGGAKRGFACAGCLEDPDADIYEMPH